MRARRGRHLQHGCLTWTGASLCKQNVLPGPQTYGLNPDECEHLQSPPIATDQASLFDFSLDTIRPGSLRKRIPPIRKQTPQAIGSPATLSRPSKPVRYAVAIESLAENCLLSDTLHRSGKPARYVVPDRHSS